MRRGQVYTQPVGAREPAAAARAHRGRVRPQARVRGHHGAGAEVRRPAGVRGAGPRRRREADHQHPAHVRRGPASRPAAAPGRRAQARARPDRQPAHFTQPAGRVLQLHYVGELGHQHTQRQVQCDRLMIKDVKRVLEMRITRAPKKETKKCTRRTRVQSSPSTRIPWGGGASSYGAEGRVDTAQGRLSS